MNKINIELEQKLIVPIHFRRPYNCIKQEGIKSEEELFDGQILVLTNSIFKPVRYPANYPIKTIICHS